MRGDPPTPCRKGWVVPGEPTRLWLPDWRAHPEPRQPVDQTSKDPERRH